jgi:steroid 5-alpha reductase family enzyme
MALFKFGWMLSALLMAYLWKVSDRRSNLGFLDLGWVASVFIFATTFAIFGKGAGNNRALVFVMVALWAGRLGLHLYRRLMADTTREDPRYVELRLQWIHQRRDVRKISFAFFQAQGLLAGLVALPLAFVALDPEPSLGLFGFLGSLLFAVGLFGESIADRQLAEFKSRPENKGQVCDIGLWARCRHPNYFFEWCVWLGVALLGFRSPYGLWSFLSPGILWLMLNRVTGIPPSEAQATRTRGDRYRSYQSRVSEFWPQSLKKEDFK